MSTKRKRYTAEFKAKVVLEVLDIMSPNIKTNSRRLHSAIGNKTPNEVYDKAMNQAEVKKQKLLEVA